MRLVRWLRESNDLAVIDLPASNTANKVFDLESLDSVVIVAKAEESEATEVARAVRRLQSKGVMVSAVVLNQSRQTVPRWMERLVS